MDLNSGLVIISGQSLAQQNDCVFLHGPLSAGLCPRKNSLGLGEFLDLVLKSSQSMNKFYLCVSRDCDIIHKT